MAKQQVVYLGYEITAGQRTLGTARKEVICQTLEPQTATELHTFLGMTGWCQLWIPNYGLLVKPLFVLLKTNPNYLTWDGETRRAFKQLKRELTQAPTLGLPDTTKAFWLFSYEKQGIALGVLAQNLGPYHKTVAYFSKPLDEVSEG